MALLILVTALTLSAVAAYYSIIGLIAIFAAAAIPVAIMGSVLEVAKLVTASWLYNYWIRIPKFLKIYLSMAVVVLMFVTSMGIFGFLSKAHLDQGVPTGNIAASVALIDEKIKTQRDNIESARKAIKQMDATVDQTISRTDDERGATNAANLRRAQGRERAQLQKEITNGQTIIAKLNDERAPVAAELRKVEAEVGPIKYIAKFIYNDEPDANILEKAVTWVIIVLIFVFDPLAVLLVIAGNMTWNWGSSEALVITPAPRRPEEPKEEDKLPEEIKEPEAPATSMTLTMPGTIGAPTMVFTEEVKEPVRNKITEDTFAPPGTPCEVWDAPLQVNSEQRAETNLDKIYKASAEELAKQKRGRTWFTAMFPTKK